MKALFLALILCVNAAIFAKESTVFHDQDTGLVVKIPEELVQTWNITNTENGLALTVFNTTEDDEDVYIIAVGKMPLGSMEGEELESFLPFLMEQLQKSFSSKESANAEEEVQCFFETLPSLASAKYPAQRFRLYLGGKDVEESLWVDVHLFIENQHVCVIMTAAAPYVDSDDLDDFSEDVLETVRFI